MMTSFWRKCPEVTFAVVQYGAEILTEFDLQESSNKSSALCKVHNVTQLGSVTKTASALQHVLNFGSEPGNKERVGDVFSKQRALKELQLIASDPDEDYLFKLPMKPWMASSAYLSEAGSGYENQNSNNNNINSDMEEDDDDSSDSGTEIAIVLDGSGSIEPEDFERAKAFIYNMMKTFYEKCFEVGEAFNKTKALNELQLIASDPDESHLFQQHILVGAVGAYDWSGGVLLYDWVTKMAAFLNESKEAKEARYGYLAILYHDLLRSAETIRTFTLIHGLRYWTPNIQKNNAHFSVIWQLDEALFPDKTANITINVTKPTPVVYVNVSQGHSENKEFQFNVDFQESRFRPLLINKGKIVVEVVESVTSSNLRDIGGPRS
ncbi:Integrin alpha-E [Chelonia mydas]|uniref:Integrin alpha-E n=1 Tax=Chelonia mydas TaxID=8469 RepID=M7BIP0_CHEMY|nr:Integrin alpha-E [Chelonia mydas]